MSAVRDAAGRPRRVAMPIALAVVAVLALASVAAVALGARMKRTALGAGGEWAEVHREDLVIAVPVSGSLAAIDAARLGPPAIAAGIFRFKITFMAPEGRTVRRGQPVLAFDPAELQKNLQVKEAERDSAEEKLKQRRATLDISRRDDELKLAQAAADERKAALKLAVPPELKRRHELEDARADLELAQHENAYYRERLRLTGGAGDAELRALAEQRDLAAARVAETRAEIASLQVAAPRDGTVVYVADRKGVKKKVGDSIWRLELVLEIPDLRHLQAEGEIDEGDAGRVAAGQPVTLRLDAHPETAFTGRVRSLLGAVEARSPANPAKVAKLKIDLDRTEPLLMRPGMRFAGTVEVQRAPGALVAPLDAVVNRADGPLVYRQTGFGSETVRPRLGRHNDRWVEVLAGLRAGDLVRRAGGEREGG